MSGQYEEMVIDDIKDMHTAVKFSARLLTIKQWHFSHFDAG